MRLTKSLQARLSYLLTHAPVVWAMWFVAVVMSPHHYHAVTLRTLALLCLLVIATEDLSHNLFSYDYNNSLEDIFPHTCWCLRIRHLVNDVRLTEHPVQLVPTTPLTVWALVAVFLISFAKVMFFRYPSKKYKNFIVPHLSNYWFCYVQYVGASLYTFLV